MTKKISESTLSKAKEMYMNYTAVNKIASILNIHRTSLQYHVNEKWRSERVLRSNELVSEFSEAKTAIVNATFSSSFKALAEWVRVKSKDIQSLRAHEAKTMMSIITEMDKIIRLDAGTATDIITEVRPMDVIEIRKKIMNSDPFIQDTEFKELPSEIDKEDIEDKIKDTENTTLS